MRNIAILIVLVASLVVFSHRLIAGAVAPAKEQFVCKLVMTEPKGNGRSIVAQPTLAVIDSQEGCFTAGGEVKVDMGAPDEGAPYGTEVRLKVHRIAGDKLRIDLYAGHGVLDAKNKSEFTIRQSGTRVVREITSGEEFAFDLDDGGQVTATINPITPTK